MPFTYSNAAFSVPKQEIIHEVIGNKEVTAHHGITTSILEYRISWDVRMRYVKSRDLFQV